MKNKQFVLILLLAVAVVIVTGCKTMPTAPDAPIETQIAQELPTGNCEMVDGYEMLRSSINIKTKYKLTMPAIGTWVMESHYITPEDGIAPGAIKKENNSAINDHLAKSCKILNEKFGVSDCSKVYLSKWTKLWNGGDGGGENIGVGGLWYKPGAGKPIPESLLLEMFQANMFWNYEDMPEYPTKYLIIYGSKAVVVNMGYEQGPPLKDGIVGFSPEVRYFLNAPDKTNIIIGKLKDQTLDYGPVQCN